ncbi:hypothetical protein LP123_07315 [Moraxella bovis]|uniref:Uncharacterized protein n=1 Tax=Moraxella bovis TaxID=476 RepID=A0AAX3EXC5_MORBO|nr:hypothetical protein [Moraxella bovis]UZA04498.1 hypothetical protein LP092_07175 [Moraxella bovis]UZA04924.1 hypothetical protein LP099_06970 [Moraxella bovis]UZA12838.1 hypothetical protein LP123_07315 [Moraxella bovis]UZA52566.1 hypothetical protein LP129_05380 [Moraxella bovis]
MFVLPNLQRLSAPDSLAVFLCLAFANSTHKSILPVMAGRENLIQHPLGNKFRRL